jgi:hypothetical protein
MSHFEFPDHASTERLAYRLWEERGRPYGSPEEDWFRAQEELRREATTLLQSVFSLSMGPHS